MPEVQSNTYYRYDDLSRVLEGFAEEYPQLVCFDSIGKSCEQREELGQLERRAYKASAPIVFQELDATEDRAKME